MSQDQAVSLTSTVVRNPDQVSGTVDGQAILLSISRGAYFDMNGMGSRIWSRLAAPIRVDELIEQLLAEFAVGQTTCENEVLAFLRALQEAQLLDIADR